MIRFKTLTVGFVLTLLLATLAHAVFILPDRITVAARVADDGTVRTDADGDGQASALPATPPVILLTGLPYIDVALNGTYTEQGATCTDATDGAIVVPAPVFTPTLNTGAAGIYTGLYTCTNSATTTATATRQVGVGQTPAPNFGPASSTFAATHGFDFAETFDGIARWPSALGTGSVLGHGNVGDSPAEEATFPRLASNNELAAWRYYSNWGGGPNSPNPADSYWIDEFGDYRVWRGTKSASVDLDNGGGPSRLGLYFFPGYDDIRLFFMVWIGENQFPTNCETTPCSWQDDTPYDFFSSWKFVTFNYDCQIDDCWAGHGGYSPHHHQITHMQNYNYGPSPGMTFHLENDGGSAVWAEPGYNLDDVDRGGTPLGYLGQWFGFEYRIQVNGTTATHDIWVYDQQGNQIHWADSVVFTIPDSDVIDFFFIGGNNTGQFDWGPTMQSTYYFDDFIIDRGSKGPIGPRYFNAIGVTQ